MKHEDPSNMAIFSVVHSIKQEVFQIAKNLNINCRFWFDQDIFDSLKTIELQGKYCDMCCDIEVCYKPPYMDREGEFEVRCRSYNPSLPSACRRCYPEISEVLMKKYGEKKIIRKRK